MVQNYAVRLLHPLLYRLIIVTKALRVQSSVKFSVTLNDRLTYFHAWHQMYVHIPSLEKLSALAAEFFGASASRGKNDQW
jgi:hypothetical protein